MFGLMAILVIKTNPHIFYKCIYFSTNMLIFAIQNSGKKNNSLLQLIVEDGKSSKVDYVGNIMPCQFFQVSYFF